MHRVLRVGVALATCMTASAAWANDPAAAQALFDDAKKLMDAHDYAEACPKLVQSQHLDPGGGTLLLLGICREREGKTATAWAIYNEAVSAAHRDARPDREKYARARIAALEPLLARLAIQVPANARAPGLRVERDGEAVPDALWGMAVPVDPGPHVVTASAPGRAGVRLDANLTEQGKTVSVVVPALAEEGDAAPPGSVPAGQRGGGTQRTLALVAGGVGVVGVGLGSVFGLIAMSRHDAAASSASCSKPQPAPCYDATAAQSWRDATSAGNVSTIAFIAGGVLLGAGAALWLTAPSSRAGATTQVGLAPTPGGAAFSVAGTW